MVTARMLLVFLILLNCYQGIVGSQTYGVAKSVNLLGVRVINSSGTSDWATVVAALSWVYNRVKMTKRPSVIK